MAHQSAGPPPIAPKSAFSPSFADTFRSSGVCGGNISDRSRGGSFPLSGTSRPCQTHALGKSPPVLFWIVSNPLFQALAARLSVFLLMGRVSQSDQVIWRVVRAVSVYMVNLLVRSKLSSIGLFPNKSMLQDIACSVG